MKSIKNLSEIRDVKGRRAYHIMFDDDSEIYMTQQKFREFARDYNSKLQNQSGYSDSELEIIANAIEALLSL